MGPGQKFLLRKRKLLAGAALLGALGVGVAGLSYLPAAGQQQSPAQAAAKAPFDHQLFFQTEKVYCDSCHSGPRPSRYRTNISPIINVLK